MPKRPREKSVTFDKRFAQMIESQKAVRYTEADLQHNAAIYESYFRAYYGDAPDFVQYVLESGGPTLRGQMIWLHLRFSQQYTVTNRIETLMTTRSLTPAQEEVYDENRVLGYDFASLFVTHRIFLCDNKVDGIDIAPEHVGLLLYELSISAPTWQFLNLRYWSPTYFDNSIRALREMASPQEAASYILLGGSSKKK